MNQNDEDAKPAAKAEPQQVEAVDEKNASWLWELVRTWGPAILAVILIRTFVFEPFRIPSGSMIPTLLIGDHVVVTKFSYGVWVPFTKTELVDIGDPSRGDIIVFRYPENPSVNYIKRVVAIPGDTIEVRDNRIVLNGVEQPTTRLDNFSSASDMCHIEQKRRFVENLGGTEHAILTNLAGGGPLSNVPRDPLTIPEGHVFVMGDNRDNSEDSRDWGFVRFDQIKGKAHRIWLSWDSCKGSIGGVRTERFLQSLYEPAPGLETTP